MSSAVRPTELAHHATCDLRLAAVTKGGASGPPAWLAFGPEAIDSGAGCGKRPIPGQAAARRALSRRGIRPATTRRNIVYDNKTVGASRSAGRSWSRAVMGLAASGALLLAGATQAHAAAVGGHSSQTGRAVTSLAGHRYEAMSAGSQLSLVQAPKGLRAAVREALGKSGATSTASAIQARLLPRDAGAQNVFGGVGHHLYDREFDRSTDHGHIADGIWAKQAVRRTACCPIRLVRAGS